MLFKLIKVNYRMTPIIVTLAIVMIAGCSDNNPDVTVKNFFIKRNDGKKSGKVIADMFSERSLKGTGITKDIAEKNLSESFDKMKFNGVKILDVRIASVEDISPDKKLYSVEIKSSVEGKEPQIEPVNLVLEKEGKNWKVSNNGFLEKYNINKCGRSADVEICIDEITTYYSGINATGRVINHGNSTYLFGFPNGSRVTISSDKNETVTGEHPSSEARLAAISDDLSNAQKLKTILPGKRDEFFTAEGVMFGVPAQFEISRIVKAEWGGLPGFDSQPFSVVVPLKGVK